MKKKQADEIKEEIEKQQKPEETEKPVEKQKIDDKDEKIKDLTESLQRLQAEFENYKKRIDKESRHTITFANANLIGQLLPMLDSFELALKHTDKQEDFVKGVELIFAQLFSILEKHGLRPIQACGRQFDPYYHEVLLQEACDRDGEVLEELQKGYMLNDKVLRFSKVKIGKKMEKKDESI
jgi:molecular chaperone GrpE